jgi:hypothetical protein
VRIPDVERKRKYVAASAVVSNGDGERSRLDALVGAPE